MTKRERQKLRRAIALLATDTGFHEAGQMLCELADLDTRGFKAMRRAKAVDIRTIARLPSRPFRVAHRGVMLEKRIG